VIRIMLVEQMRLLRGALATILSAEDDLEVAAEIGRADEVLPMARAVRPDVLVTDVNLLRDGDTCVVAEMNSVLPGCAILVLADPAYMAALRRVLNTQVRGFVGTDTRPGQLAGHIRRVANGERVIDPTLAVAALTAPHNPLTPREREVLAALASGAPSADVARRLHLSRGTVCNYVSAILRKTGARNRLEAVRMAEEAGWL